MHWVYRRALGVSIACAWLTCLPTHAASGFTWVAARETKPIGSNAYQMVTGDDSDGNRKQWDSLYSTERYVYGREPALFVQEVLDRLPRGRALDIAMGEGRNAVYLAKKGFEVEGVDYSEVALRKARKLAAENRVTIQTVNADLESYVIKENAYEVILVIDYLQRNLFAGIKKGLKKGGMVLIENQTLDQLKIPGSETIRRDFLLKPGELKEHFKDFEILIYRETKNQKSAVASLLARKP